MNPSIVDLSLTDRTVQAAVEHLRARGEMWLQDLHIVGFEIRVYRIVWILEIGQLARARGAHFAASCRKALGDAVIAKRAFVGDVLRRMEIPAAVGASLDAVTATEAIILIDEHDSVGCVERGANRADLCAGRIRALIAQFRNEEVLSSGQVAWQKTVLPASG